MKELDKDTFDRTWKIIEEIGVQERHFNDIQVRYRNMASIWLLATFSAIGFIVSKTIHIGIDQELLVAGIAIAGSMGIALIWVVDLLVYQRLLDACFIEALILEDKYSWLPPLRNNMMKTQKDEGVLFRVVGFYLGPIVLLILVAGSALTLWLGKECLSFAVVCFVSTLITGLFAGYLICLKTENTSTIERALAKSSEK